jgi:hypothetical protein
MCRFGRNTSLAGALVKARGIADIADLRAFYDFTFGAKCHEKAPSSWQTESFFCGEGEIRFSGIGIVNTI